LLLSILLHGLLLSLQFGIPAFKAGHSASITVSLAPSPVAPPLSTSAPVATLPAPQVAEQPLVRPLPAPPPQVEAPEGLRLLDPAEPAKPIAPPLVRYRKHYRARTRRTKQPDSPRKQVARVIADDPKPDSNFVMPLPEPDQASVQTLEPSVVQDEPDAQIDEAMAQLKEDVKHEPVAVQADQDSKVAAELDRQRKEEQERAIARQQAEEQAQQQEKQEAARRHAEELAQQQAEQQAALHRAEELAQQQAQQEAVRRHAEELAQQQAEQQAALSRAEELAQQQAQQEAARRHAEELAQQQAEQQAALRRTEELAQQQAQQQAARRHAEELARQQAEQEAARRRAVELARQQLAEQELIRQRIQEPSRPPQGVERSEIRTDQVQPARQASLADPARPTDDGIGSSRGKGDGQVGVPHGLRGSDLVSRASELMRGIDVLGGAPPAVQHVETAVRRAVVSGVERDVALRLYVDSVRQKIERNGMLNRAELSAERVRIDPLVSVSVRSDGSVDDVTILRSSGRPEMDDAVRRIVRLNARYSAFPPNVAAHYDVIEIRRIWTFAEGLKLIEELR
jgi:TonB family protein